MVFLPGLVCYGGSVSSGRAMPQPAEIAGARASGGDNLPNPAKGGGDHPPRSTRAARQVTKYGTVAPAAG